jgi:hypothetical protein
MPNDAKDLEWEDEIVADNVERVEDLVWSLCAYDEEAAKRVLAEALGRMLGYENKGYQSKDLVPMIEEARAEVVAEVAAHAAECKDCGASVPAPPEPHLKLV